MKQLLVCPFCLEKGKKEVLGQFNEDGSFEILRFRNATTRVISGEFEIRCGICGESIFYRVKKK